MSGLKHDVKLQCYSRHTHNCHTFFVLLFLKNKEINLYILKSFENN